MEPSRICTRRQEANSQRIFMRLLYPMIDFASIWWIHPVALRPLLCQAIIGFGEIRFHFAIVGRRANVELKIEYVIQFIEKRLRRLPFDCFGTEVDGDIYPWKLPL